jgi:hypothetical protein
MALERSDINLLKEAFSDAIRQLKIDMPNGSNGGSVNVESLGNTSLFSLSDELNFKKNLNEIYLNELKIKKEQSKTHEEELDADVKFQQEQRRIKQDIIDQMKDKLSSGALNKDEEKTMRQLLTIKRKELSEENEKLKEAKKLRDEFKSLSEEEKSAIEERIKNERKNAEIKTKLQEEINKKYKEELIRKGENGSFKGDLGKYILNKDITKNILEAYGRGGRGVKGVANAVGVGLVNGAGVGLEKTANFLNKDKVSITDVGKQVSDITSNFGPWGKAIGAAAQGIAMMVEEYDKLNVAAQGYVRNVGGGERAMQKMKIQASAVASEISKWGGMAYKMQDILKNMAELSEKTGRNFEYMSKSQYKSLEDLTKFGIDKDVISQYDTFGLSVDVIDKKIASIYSTAGKHGLNAKAVTNAVTKNLKMAQNYTFASGVKALERMAERSVALKFNMDQAARFADKVSTLEGAVQAGAGLSVLGGDFARFGNPLQMLYEGLNDAEGLMDRMVNMYSSMAKFDEKKGHIDITSFNRVRMKQAAQEMGVDPSEMMSMAMNLARENMVTSQLGKGLDKPTETYIKNIARINEKGEAVVTFNAGQENEETKAVSSLTMEDKMRLKNESDQKTLKEGATVGDILVTTRTVTDKLNDILDVLKTRIVNMMAKLVGGTDEEMAQNMGLNKANAELFEDISDDFYTGKLHSGSVNILKQLGMSAEDIAEAEKGRNGKGKFSQDEFDQKLISLLNAAQAQGYTKAKTKGWDIYKYSDNNWIKDDKEVDMGNKKLFSHGGSVVGPGGPKDDLIHARLSNGEYVINAAAAAKNRGTLDAINAQGYANGGPVRPIKDQLRSMVVKAGGAIKNGLTNVADKLSIEPININMNGTLTLSLNGQTTTIDSKVLLDSLKPAVIDYINEQLLNRKEFRIARNKTHDKFGIGMA